MFKKAQAAMEFLMTYGWAILVVLAAIGALAYFGVLSPGNLLPQRCEFSAGLDCTETPDASSVGQTITFPLTNSVGYKIQMVTTSLSGGDGVTACTGTTWDPVTATTTGVLNGDSVVITMTGCTGMTQGERYSADVTVQYTSNSTGMSHSTVGRIAGKAR